MPFAMSPAAPDFTMARIARATLFALATEPAAAEAARADVLAAKASSPNDREASLLVALDRMLAGDWNAAALALDRHQLHYPHDLLALQAGHLSDFYRANARNLRDRLARVLPRWSPDMPAYSILLGMYAFGLEETADYARAEATAWRRCRRPCATPTATRTPRPGPGARRIA